MSILFSWVSILRTIFITIDGVVFSVLDNAYNIVITLSNADIITSNTIQSITKNLYILFGIVAFFRLAVVLVNSIIDPEKLNEKGKGLSNIFFRVVGMIVILFITPFLFEKSYELQGKIVGGNPENNIIFKSILGDRANIAGENAGNALQNIILSSLITVNDNYYDEFVPVQCISNEDGTCTNQGGYIYGEKCNWGNCKTAISKYNSMYVNENMSPVKLAGVIGVSRKIDGEEVFVFDYMLIGTTIVAGFITYIILSFAIDIAVRMFELVVLEIISPLFIATFVDPKSTQSGPFKNWLTAVGKSYAALYIKLAIIALMILLLYIINTSRFFQNLGDISGITKVFIIIGLLIFAKKAPKWIMDIIGIKGDGMGLWSPKKLRENMFGTGAAMAGAATGAALIGNRLANHNNRKKQRQDNKNAMNTALDKSGYKDKKDLKRRGIIDDDGKHLYGNAALGYFSRQHGVPKNPSIGQSILQDTLGAGNAIIQGVKMGKGAGNLTDAIKAGAQVTTDFKTKNALEGEGIFAKAGKGARRVIGGINDAAWGTAADRFDANKRKEKLEKLENYLTQDAIAEFGQDIDNKVLGLGDISKMEVKPRDFGDLMAMSYAKAKGATCSYDNNGDLNIIDSNGEIILRDEAMSKGRAMYGDEGISNMQKAYNTFQQNSVSEATTGAQNISQLVSAIQSMSSHLDNMNILGMDDKKLKFGDGAEISINKKSIKSLQAAQSEVMNRYNSAAEGSSEKEQLRQQGEDISNMISFIGQLDSSYKDLSVAQTRQKELSEIVAKAGVEYNVKDMSSKDLGFTSNEEIKQYLSVKSGDFDKEVAFAEEARKKKKGTSDDAK